MDIALFYVISGHESVAELLINNGIDVNIVNERHDNALSWATFKGISNMSYHCVINANKSFSLQFTGPERLVKLLIENGADVNSVNQFNKSPLIFALISGTQKKKETITCCSMQSK